MQEVQETQVQFVGREEPLEEEMAIHSSILAQEIPMDRGACRAPVHGVVKSWTKLSDRAQHISTCLHEDGVFWPWKQSSYVKKSSVLKKKKKIISEHT